jgi:hypothetical protein
MTWVRSSSLDKMMECNYAFNYMPPSPFFFNHAQETSSRASRTISTWMEDWGEYFPCYLQKIRDAFHDGKKQICVCRLV